MLTEKKVNSDTMEKITSKGRDQYEACMTAVSPRRFCETSLVMRSEERRLYALVKDETEL